MTNPTPQNSPADSEPNNTPEGLLELLRQTIDDSTLTHTGRSIGDRASEHVARDAMTVLEDIISQAIDQKIDGIERAYGGCHKCYGKGYATVRQGLKGFADFGDDGFVSEPRNRMKFCTCDRGKQLEALLQKHKEQPNQQEGAE